MGETPRVVSFSGKDLTILFLSSLSALKSLRVGTLNIDGGSDRDMGAAVTELISTKKITKQMSSLFSRHNSVDNEVEWGMSYRSLSHGIKLNTGVAFSFSVSPFHKCISM